MTNKSEKLYYASPVWLQNILVSAMGYHLFHKRYTGSFRALYQQVSESREWNKEQRTAWQNEQLHQMIRHCRYNIPYYGRLFAEYGLHENDFTHIHDLPKLPILDKQTVREHSQVLRTPWQKPYVIQHTSGSTGTPLALAVNETTYKLAMALVMEHEQYHGIPFGAPRATFAGRLIQKSTDMTPPFSRFNRAENQRLYSSYHLSEQTFPSYRSDLDHFQPQELIGYPSAISDLANYYEQSSKKPKFKPKAVITNSETLLAWQREKIENIFQCPVFDYYGTAEYLTFAGQDNSGRYYLSPLPGVTEVVHEADSDNMSELISTTLTNFCMPLLRYRLGDTAITGHEGEPITSFPRQLAAINGRIDDYIETPDGRRIGRMDHIFKGVSGIREGQLIQEATNHCKARIVLQPNSTALTTEKLIKNFHSRTGNSMTLSLEVCTDIPKGANGKFRSVINNLTA